MNLVGERVLEARVALGWSQTKLSDRVGDITNAAWQPSRDDIYRVEAGTRTVSDLEALALAAALEREVGWLIAGNTQQSTAEIVETIFHPNS